MACAGAQPRAPRLQSQVAVMAAARVDLSARRADAENLPPDDPSGEASKRPRLCADDEEAKNFFPEPPCRCTRIKRTGWAADDFLKRPVGVHEVQPKENTAVKFHAVFGARLGHQPVHLGCFATAPEAAAAWDNEARRRGFRLVNTPQPGERCVLQAVRLRGEFAERAGFPHLPQLPAWRLLQPNDQVQSVNS